MPEPSKRELAATLARRALIRTFHTIEDTLDAAEDIRAIINLIVDAAKDEVRAELDAGVKARMPRPADVAKATIACPKCGSTNVEDLEVLPPIRTCRACGYGWTEAKAHWSGACK